MDLIPILKTLTQVTGVSGFEHTVREEIRAIWSPLADECWTDTLGNLIAVKRGNGTEPRRKLMLASHMDEIGLMVTQVRQGFLTVTAVGGTDLRLLLGQQVLVHGRRDLPGIIGSRPPHLLKPGENEELVPWDKLVVDVGLPAKEVADLVRVGDHVSFRQELRELLGGRVAGKALDNRAAVACLAFCLQALQSRAHCWDVVAVATVQEEETMGGARTGAFRLQPDVSIAVDVTQAEGPGVSREEAMALDKGPAIGYGPNNHPGLHRALVESAKAIELRYQVEPMPRGGGTDAWAMEVVRAGVPTAVVCIPLRNMHMPVELVAVSDVERTGRLLAEFAGRLDDKFIEKYLAWDRDTEEECRE